MRIKLFPKGKNSFIVLLLQHGRRAHTLLGSAHEKFGV